MTKKQDAPVVKTAVEPITALRNTIEQMSPQFKAALPEHVSVDRFKRVVMTAINEKPELIDAERTSLFAALMRCASDGLFPDSREAAIVTFKMKSGDVRAQYMPMIQGIFKKIRNSGEIASIATQVVYETDEFSFWIDEFGEHLKHVPKLSGDRGGIVYVYAVGVTKDRASYIEVMSSDEIEFTRSKSRAKDSGPWVDWWAEMAKKTVIRRLAKRLPMSTDLDGVIRADDELYDLDPVETPKESAKTSSRLRSLIQDSPTASEVPPNPES